MNQQAYFTTELELAAFLKASGHRLVSAKPQGGKFVSFEFDPNAADDADRFFAGAEVAARELFEAHRSLRVLIQQITEHRSQRNDERKINREYQPRR
jgi:predicted O-methyltransferase YrrM